MKNPLEQLNSARSYAKLFERMDVTSALRMNLDSLNSARSYAKLFERMDVTSALRMNLDSLNSARSYAKLFERMDVTSALRMNLDSLNSARSYAKLFSGFADTLNREFRDPATATEESIKAINKLNDEASKYTKYANEVVINDNNSITLNETTLTYDEVNKIVNDVADKAFSDHSQKLEKTIESLLILIKSQKNPLAESLSFQLFYPIIIALFFAFINPVVGNIVNQNLNKNEKIIEKNIIKEVAKQAPSTSLKNYRLVTARALNVRQNPKARAHTIGKLYFGSIVVVIDKQKDWSLVMWSDADNGTSLTGWVFTRYLRKFN